MGAFNKRPPVRIENQPDWESGEWIQIKGVVTAEDMEAMTVQNSSVGADGNVVTSSSMSMVAALQCMIEDWMLLGDNNVPVALYDGRRKRVEVIAKLPTEYMAPVMAAIGEIINKQTVQQPENFTNSANAPSGANLTVVK